MELSLEEVAFSREAIQLAEEAEKQGNLPIGALIILNGEVIARGSNSIWQPKLELTRHAEMEALRGVPQESGKDPARWFSLQPLSLA